MINNLKTHIGYNISLILVLAFGFLLVLLSSPNRDLQMLLVILITLIYISLGIVHHLINHDLHTKIVVEYMLIGALGISIVFFIL